MLLSNAHWESGNSARSFAFLISIGHFFFDCLPSFTPSIFVGLIMHWSHKQQKFETRRCEKHNVKVHYHMEINSPQYLLNFLVENMKYGFEYDGKIYTNADRDEWIKHYKIKLGENLIRTGYGACFDFAEFQRQCFEKWGYEHECYFLRGYRDEQHKDLKALPFHTFLVYNDGNKWKWFEYSFRVFRGIHEYETKAQAIKDVVAKALEYHQCVKDKYDLYKYPKVTKNLTVTQFIKHCLKGERCQL